MMYGELCTKFYDADKQFASAEEVNFYKNFFNKNDFLLEPMCGSGSIARHLPWIFSMLLSNPERISG